MKKVHLCPTNAEGLLYAEKQRKLFTNAGWESIIISYDQNLKYDTQGNPLQYVKGGKWQIAKQVLTGKYDYVALWDDDIDVDVNTFDLVDYMRIFIRNELSASQPGIINDFVSHPVTKRQSIVRMGNATGKKIAGRETDWVEIMVPVMTGETWELFKNYIDDAGFYAWGLDFVNNGKKGIIDKYGVYHTRKHRGPSEAQRKMVEFVKKRGLSYPEWKNLGYLLDA